MGLRHNRTYIEDEYSYRSSNLTTTENDDYFNDKNDEETGQDQDYYEDAFMHDTIPQTMWSNEMLRIEALKYKTRTQFNKCQGIAYQIALNRGILGDICRHMESFPARNYKWTDEMLHSEALKYSTRYAFQKGSMGAYQSAYCRGILDEICIHMATQPRTIWTNDMIFIEALKYSARKDFRRLSNSAYQTALNRGILDEVCYHMEAIPKIWSNKKLHAEAAKYTSKFDFKINSNKAYISARRRGVLTEITKHMV